MVLSDLAALGSFVSGAAVLVSLIFLYFQLRQIAAQIDQAEKNQRALMSQGAINRSVTMNCWTADRSALFVKATTDAEHLNDEDAFMLSAFVRNVLLNFQDYHLQRKMGLADEITYNNAITSIRYFLSMPAMRATYLIRHGSYAPELAALVDAMLETVPVQTPPPMGEQLQAALSGLLAGKTGATDTGSAATGRATA